jgi:hypothetical protein
VFLESGIHRMSPEEYLRRGRWKCGKSPTGAHHWLHVVDYIDSSSKPGLFECKYCYRRKRFPLVFSYHFWEDNSGKA